MEKLNEQCEGCGKTECKMELHEAATFKNKTYIFNGFILLCQHCHDMVHCINISSNLLGVNKNTIDFIWSERCSWNGKYNVKKQSLFKTKAAFSKHVYQSFNQVFDFMMADSVSCDYSNVAKYGFDPKLFSESFKKRYNHFVARIRYMAWYLNWFFLREKTGLNTDQRFYDLYYNQTKVKEYQSVLHNEYLKHKDYYDDDKITFGPSSAERDQMILDYAEVMKQQLLSVKSS